MRIDHEIARIATLSSVKATIVPCAEIIPFPLRHAGLTQHERARILDWCLAHGLDWDARLHRTEDHGAYVAILTPRSTRYRSGHVDPAWIVLREGSAIVVFDPMTQNDLGSFATVTQAMAAITLAEEATPRTVTAGA